MNSIAIGLTNRCNLSCIMCRRGNRKFPIYDRSLDELKAIVTALKPKWVEIGGDGENTLHPKFTEALRLLKSLGFKVGITTNLNVNSQDVLNAIIKYTDRVNISVDGATKDTYEMIRGGDFDLVMKNMMYLRQNGKTFNINFVILRYNIDEIPLIYKLAKRLGAGVLFLYPESLDKHTDELHPFWEMKKLEKYKHIINKPFKPSLREDDCPQLSNPTITLDGKMACCFGRYAIHCNINKVESWFMGTKVDVDPQDFIFGDWRNPNKNKLQRLENIIKNSRKTYSSLDEFIKARWKAKHICEVCPNRYRLAC
ncbi:MAG TPA: radical SAM protein [Archaeoglobus sp.]|nr:radical SAM protein [Archaeoglobus sp.]